MNRQVIEGSMTVSLPKDVSMNELFSVIYTVSKNLNLPVDKILEALRDYPDINDLTEYLSKLSGMSTCEIYTESSNKDD